MVQSDTDFRQLVETFQHKVYNQAFRMLGNREEAEEATQDIFLKVHGALKDFRGDSKLSSWIFRIAANVCVSRMRKKQLKTSSLDQPLGEEGRSVAEILPDESDNPEEEYSSNELGGIVREQLRRLKPEWAQALSLHYFGGQSYEEVAEVMEIPRATVATYIRRGKMQLASQITANIGKDGVFLK
ncbi:MAG: sigma-70 family RNA polymerase sigma factor [Chloroflexi bacterium]|jgi:RNA polymerase sigma-70 factor, ECF subfamily|nr:sigma-70 family RNA polymerase sigma factor [Chloroflexota bacterium]